MRSSSIIKRCTPNKTHFFCCSLIIVYHMPYKLQLFQECYIGAFYTLVLWTCRNTSEVTKCPSYPTMYRSWQVPKSRALAIWACVISRCGSPLLHNNLESIMITLFKLVYKVRMVNINQDLFYVYQSIGMKTTLYLKCWHRSPKDKSSFHSRRGPMFSTPVRSRQNYLEVQPSCCTNSISTPRAAEATRTHMIIKT